jgi:exodeoxyribonuclease VII large subunit
VPEVQAGVFSVPELNEAIRLVLEQAFSGEVWVEGEISSLRRSPAGHVYLDLIEPGEPGQPPLAALPVSLFASARQHVNRVLRRAGIGKMGDGMRVRIRGKVDVHAARGRLHLRMSGIDPTYTLGLLVSERDRLVAQLEQEGVLGRNGALALPPMPATLGLVTSDGSAAMADFLHELELSGLGWRVVAVDVRVQGAGADRHVAAGLRAVAAAGADAVALVRGGGSRIDLATFDSEVVARAIATLGVPVVVGIGHEIDASVADLVAHTSYKTPTACAAGLVAGARGLVDRAEGAWSAIGARSGRLLDRRAERLGQAAARAGSATRNHLRRHHADADRRAERLAERAPRALQLAERRLDAAATHVSALDPVRTLARGWSITRTADGTPVRRPSDVAEGTELVTSLAGGTIASRVTGTTTDREAAP